MSNDQRDFDDPLTLGEAIVLCIVYAASGGFVAGLAVAVYGWFF